MAYTGAVTINSGSTLQIGAGSTSGSLGAGTIVDNGSLVYDRSDTLVVGAAISGTGTLTQSGTGTLALATGATYTGGTVIQSGVLQLTGSATLGSGSYAGTIANSGTFRYSSTANQTLSGIISGIRRPASRTPERAR